MAFDLRAPVPIRFQRYISNTPVWESGETYFAGDIVKYRVAGSALDTDPTDTLYVAKVTLITEINRDQNPSDLGLYWAAAAAGDVALGDIIIPTDPLSVSDGQAFRTAIGANFETRVANLETADTTQDGLIAANLEADLGNVLATGYATVPDANKTAFKAALDIQGSADAVTDGDVFLEGDVLPSTASTITVGHIMIGGIIHPLGGTTDEVPVGIFAVNLNQASAVQGSDEDGTAPADIQSVITITTDAPHVMTGVTASITAPPVTGAVDFNMPGVVALSANGLMATVSENLPTLGIRDYTITLTIAYTTGGVAGTDAIRTESFSVGPAPVAAGTFTFAPTDIIHGGPDVELAGTVTYTGGFGSLPTDLVFPAVQGFSGTASVVGVTEAGTNRAGAVQFSSFTVSGIMADATTTSTGRQALVNNASLYSSLDELDSDALSLTSNLISVSAPPARATMYHGWTQMPYNAGGSGDSEITGANVMGQADDTEASYALGQQVMTVPGDFATGDVSYMIAIPVTVLGTEAFAIINIGGEQAVAVTQSMTEVTIAAEDGVAIATPYNVFLVKAINDYDSLDRVNVQTLIVE